MQSSTGVTMDVVAHLVERMHAPHIPNADPHSDDNNEEDIFHPHNNLMYNINEEHAFCPSSEEESWDSDPPSDTDAWQGSPSLCHVEIAFSSSASRFDTEIVLAMTAHAFAALEFTCTDSPQ